MVEQCSKKLALPVLRMDAKHVGHTWTPMRGHVGHTCRAHTQHTQGAAAAHHRGSVTKLVKAEGHGRWVCSVEKRLCISMLCVSDQNGFLFLTCLFSLTCLFPLSNPFTCLFSLSNPFTYLFFH